MKRLVGYILFLLQLMLRVGIILACHRAEYQIGRECCPMCPEGTHVNKHCTEFRSTSCLPCDDFTYMDQPTGRTQCIACRICISDLKVKKACSSKSNALCEPQQGFFCERLSEDGNCDTPKKHSSCKLGEFIQQPGSASADTKCSKCADGTFSNGTLSKCQPHTQCKQMNKDTIKPGTSSSDAECGEKNSMPLIIGISVVVFLAISVTAVLICLKKTGIDVCSQLHKKKAIEKNPNKLDSQENEPEVTVPLKTEEGPAKVGSADHYIHEQGCVEEDTVQAHL